MPKTAPTVARPLPTFATSRGLPAYDPRELLAYRMAHAITGFELATHMKTKQPAIARWESARYGMLEARYGDRLLAHIERIVENRARLAEEGAAMLEEIRAAR